MTIIQERPDIEHSITTIPRHEWDQDQVADIARELDVRTIDTISIKSYDRQKQSETVVLKAPDATLMGDGTGILIVDDLVDSGKTLEVVRKMYPKAHFATVYAKPKGRPQVDTFITEVSQDTWILFPWDTESQFVVPLAGRDRS